MGTYQFQVVKDRENGSLKGCRLTDLPLLHQPGFFVVFHSTRMEGRGQTIQHAFLGQATVGRMKFLEIFEVFKNFFDDGVDHIVRNFGRCHESAAAKK